MNDSNDNKLKTSMVLKKHVGLIHSENKLSLLQRKISNILLYNALEDIGIKDIFEINLSELCALINFNSRDIELIKSSLRNLMTTIIEWNLLEKDITDLEEAKSISWNASSLLAGVNIEKGSIKYSYSPQIKSVMTTLDVYGRINLFVQASFSSAYSLVLYENCVRFKNIHQTCWFSLELFRNLMGVGKDKYPLFKELKRNVISPAIKEINEKSDITIDVEYKKSGRAISALKFHISSNENYAPKLKVKANTASFKAKIKNELKSRYDIQKIDIEELINDYGVKLISKILNEIREKTTSGEVTNKKAYLKAVLKKQFNEKQGSVYSHNPDRYEQALKSIQSTSEIDSYKKKYRKYKSTYFSKALSQINEDVRHKILEAFERMLVEEGGFVFEQYKSKGLNSGFVIERISEFLIEHYRRYFQDFKNFDEFLVDEDLALEM